MNKPQFIVVHHTASSRDKTTVPMIDSWHKARQFPKSELGFYVGYHYVILGDGQLVQTRKDNEVGAHTKTADGMNFKSIGICLTGNFETEQPSEAQLNRLKELLYEKMNQYNISKISTHKDFVNTACPGKNLSSWLQEFSKKKEKITYKTKNDNAFVLLIIADDTLDQWAVKNYIYEAQIRINQETEKKLVLDCHLVFHPMPIWDNAALRQFIKENVDMSCFQGYVTLYRKDKYREYLGRVEKEPPLLIVQGYQGNPYDPSESPADVLAHELMAHGFMAYLNFNFGRSYDLLRGDKESPTDFKDDWDIFKHDVEKLYFNRPSQPETPRIELPKNMAETKPGVKTSEFWLTLMTTFTGLAVTLGYLTPEQSGSLVKGISDIVGGILTIVPTLAYIWSRVKVKTR